MSTGMKFKVLKYTLYFFSSSCFYLFNFQDTNLHQLLTSKKKHEILVSKENLSQPQHMEFYVPKRVLSTTNFYNLGDGQAFYALLICN